MHHFIIERDSILTNLLVIATPPYNQVHSYKKEFKTSLFFVKYL